ncbi:RNU1 [Symbiodinium natans]|uniref:RNU1 protein n=1 Tax=Symbiodinium natans TaxID=878477 RepID=A0A812HFT2_9DINO|nr:RNU1 [Symbiodinium natans]
MADNYGKGKRSRKGGKKGEDYDSGYGKGYGAPRNNSNMGSSNAGGKPAKDAAQVHHYPPKEMAADVGYPVRGGQTLLIAYFPWEASEADIEREFSKFCRVKRVHLVVDKSSRKPRCFGFVKFLSKADAEEALRATTQGLVQLPDTRGHVWHLKAEWTKSGDMVVDDSEAEQEVAKRKEERRSRTDTATPGAAPRTNSGKGSAPPPKGALHPGVPAPLPPLQTRYPPQAAIGMPPPPPAALQQHQQRSLAHSHVPPLQQPLPHQGQLYGQHMYGSQGQQLYSNQASIYGGGVPVAPLGRDPVGGGLDAGGAPPLLRDINSYAHASAAAQQAAYPGSSYAAAVAAAAAHAPGYPPAQSQSYVGQPYAGSQQPYVSQQAYAGTGQYSAAGQQAAYAAGQQAYQTAAATASSAVYPSAGGAYPPQAQSGYGAPPGYGAAAQYSQQPASYPTNPATAYAAAGYGLGQSPYNYLQQPAGSGVVAYPNYQGAQGQVAQAQPQQPQAHVQPYTQPQADPTVATGSLGRGPVRDLVARLQSSMLADFPDCEASTDQQSQQQYLDMVHALDPRNGTFADHGVM